MAPDQSNPVEKISRRRRIVFSTLTGLLAILVTFAAGEAMVRLAVPERTFSAVSNIYRTSEIEGVIYTYKANYDGVAFDADLKTNSLGFRGPEWSREKSPGVVRIALIGDSHAFGFGVAYDKSVGPVLAGLLEARDGVPVEVLNFAANGYNSHQQRAVLERLALGYDPDMVVLMPSSNDHEAPYRADADGWLHWDGRASNTRSRIIDKSTAETRFPVVNRLISKSALLSYLLLIRKRQRLASASAGPEDEPPKDASDRWMRPVSPGPPSERLAETVHEPMVAMLSQLKARSIPAILAPIAGFADYRRMFQSLNRDYDVPVVELLALFPEANGWDQVTASFGLGWDEHLNDVAHRRFAEGIAAVIEPLPPNPLSAIESTGWWRRCRPPRNGIGSARDGDEPR